MQYPWGRSLKYRGHDLQELTLSLRARIAPGVAAVTMALLSQASTLRSLSMRFDAMPPGQLHALASLPVLTDITVRPPCCVHGRCLLSILCRHLANR